MQGRTETRVGIFVLAALAIFAYMGFQIGAFRFDRANYTKYTMYFKDIAGLTRKADVKIAGVKVGWVEKIKLVPDTQMQAEAEVMVLKEYILYSDSYAMVRQEGLLGPKYLEIVPGDPLLRPLEAGEALGKPSTEPVSIDELMQQFKKIAGNVESVTESFKSAVGGYEGRQMLDETFANLHTVAERMASFSEVLDRSFARNEDNLDVLLSVGNDIKSLANKLESDVLPVFRDSIDRISNVFDRDFNRIATQIEATAGSLQEASIQARDGLKSLGSVAEKIDEGKGTIGKLINEDETYRDLKVAVEGIKNYFAQADRLQIVFDSHFESMHRPAENYEHNNSKGYFDIRLHTNQDHFYLVQLASNEKGWVDRREVHREYCDIDGCPIDVDKLDLSDNDKLENVFNKKFEVFTRNSVRIGLQFGKIFGDVAFRFGLFEGLAGAGVDIDIPFKTENFRWVTSFEAFDFSGWNRKNDKRPHLKWVNRIFLFNSIYFTFGADDFASKRNANVFVGGGIRFGDNDVKFLMSNLGGVSSLSGGYGSSDQVVVGVN